MITIIIIIPQNNLIRHQVVIQNEEACVLTKEDMLSQSSPTSPSWFWTSTSPTPTSQLTSSSSMMEDAKKTDNNVVKVKGCLIDVHVDINNLPPFPSDHQILIVLQCLMISWEKSIMEKIIQPKSKIVASAAIPFPVRQMHEHNSH